MSDPMPLFQSDRLRSILSAPRGYTLLELLLALALTVVILGLIATSIQVNLLSLTRIQNSLERKQTARGILTMIHRDLRAGVQYKASDYSGLEDLIASQKLIEGQSSADAAALAGEEPEVPEELDDGVDDEVELAVPIFRGEPNYLDLDISRLPRLDQYYPAIASDMDSGSTASDVKTVAWYMGTDRRRQSTGGGAADNDSQSATGLFRREIDRAVAEYQGTRTAVEPDEFSMMVATEVFDLSFRYFDGSEWADTWDSETKGGFPLAVEIVLLVGDESLRLSAGDNVSSASDLSSNQQDLLETYRSVVHLPIAEIMEEEESE